MKHLKKSSRESKAHKPDCLNKIINNELEKKNIERVLADTLNTVKITDQDIDTLPEFRDLMPEQRSELIELVYTLSIALCDGFSRKYPI